MEAINSEPRDAATVAREYFEAVSAQDLEACWNLGAMVAAELSPAL